MSNRYILGEDNSFRKARTSVWAILRKVLVFLIATASMAVLYYIVLALFFSTDTEKRLSRENRMYEKLIPEMEAKEELLADVINGLQVRDNMIYDEVFHTAAPSINPLASLGSLSGLDTIPDTDLVSWSRTRLDRIETAADRVEDNFRAVADAVAAEGFVMPPMTSPLDRFSFARTGASTGDRINPFYKVTMRHDGFDMIASAGEPVRVVADGKVVDIQRSRRGLGNVVTVQHDGGYVTRYAHLADVEVFKGKVLRKGAKIGVVGLSGNSFAPHLHYEVHRDTLVLDPVNHFFASVSVDDYVNMLILSVSTGQSMD